MFERNILGKWLVKFIFFEDYGNFLFKEEFFKVEFEVILVDGLMFMGEE